MPLSAAAKARKERFVILTVGTVEHQGVGDVATGQVTEVLAGGLLGELHEVFRVCDSIMKVRGVFKKRVSIGGGALTMKIRKFKF